MDVGLGNKLMPGDKTSDEELTRVNEWLQQPRKFTLILSEQQLGVLNQCLVKAPYEISAPLINHINAQIAQQRKAK